MENNCHESRFYEGLLKIFLSIHDLSIKSHYCQSFRDLFPLVHVFSMANFLSSIPKIFSDSNGETEVYEAEY